MASQRPPETAKASAANASGEESYFECNICLDGVREPVVTRCGHLFCWPCLYRWLSTNQTECPVCKAGVTARNVIPLYGRGADNIDPRTKPTGPGSVPNRPEAERPAAERPRPPNVFAGGLGGVGWGGGGAEGGVGAGGQVHFQAGLGFFPSLFGLQFQSFTTFPTEATGTSPAGGNAPPRGQPNSENRPADAEGASQAEGDGNGADGGAGGDGATNAGRTGGPAGGPGVVGGAGSRVLSPEEVQQAFLSRLLLALGSFVVVCLVMF